MSELKQTFYSQYDGAYRLYLELTEKNVDKVNNTSKIDYRLGMTRTSSNRFNQYRVGYSISLNNNQVAYLSRNDAPQIGFNSGVYDITITSGTATVKHNNDGSLNMPLSASIDMDEDTYGPGVMSLSGNFALTTIPRASLIQLSDDHVYAEQSITATITVADPAFRHKVSFFMFDKDNDNDSYTYYYSEDIAASNELEFEVDYDIPRDWCENMPTSTSHIAYCEVQTLYGETLIGQVVESFTIDVPDYICPTIGEISIIPDLLNQKQILVKGKNKLSIGVKDCSAGYGSSIVSYTFSGPELSQVVFSSKGMESIELDTVSSVGELEYTVTVTDSRGRSVSTTQTITCHDYYAPSFITFNAYRSDADGKADMNGSCLTYSYLIDYANVNNTNNVSVKLTYATTTNTITTDSIGYTPDTCTQTINLNDAKSSYKVYAVVEDSYGGRNSSPVINIFGESRIMNITSDGTGFAIGKIAESSNLFECRWNAKFNGDVDCQDFTINGKSIFDLIYPVGSIYMSMNDRSPNILFGGEWEKIEEGFLNLSVYMWQRVS